jgi:putative membrane protein
MLTLINLNYLTNSVVFSLVGFIMLGLGFYFFDKLTPWKLWKEIIEEQNMSLAIIVAAMVLGISYIIASSITG